MPYSSARGNHSSDSEPLSDASREHENGLGNWVDNSDVKLPATTGTIALNGDECSSTGDPTS